MEMNRLKVKGLVIGILLFLIFYLLPITASAQERRPCVRNIPTGVSGTRGMLGYPTKNWDPQRIYRVAVVLISFSDCDFSMDDPVAYYQRILNESGYNEGYGMGSLADYYRDQSGGRFNLQLDVYGPIKVSAKVQNSSVNYGDDAMDEAMEILNDTAPDVDFSIYDWDGDGEVEQIVFIAAGFCGNQVNGCIWPNTSFAFFMAPGGISVRMASITCELWKDGTSCGIGTISHELAHCLGLPDIYPTVSSDFSVVDEWDLMDGGNYTNKGWCPPNFSAMEKMCMGWTTPIELTKSTTVTGMKPVSEGGETYIIRNSGNVNEFYLLENRRQTRWDYGIPGEGLAIFHVDYDREKWSSNQVNVERYHYRYDLFHADGKDYRNWDPTGDGTDMSKYTMDHWMRNCYLSTSVYPYADTFVVNQSLTDDANPNASVYAFNADGVKLMSKPITNICMADDGTISFDFMKNEDTGIVTVASTDEPDAWYTIDGRRLGSQPTSRGLYIHGGKKIVIK